DLPEKLDGACESQPQRSLLRVHGPTQGETDIRILPRQLVGTRYPARATDIDIILAFFTEAKIEHQMTLVSIVGAAANLKPFIGILAHWLQESVAHAAVKLFGRKQGFFHQPFQRVEHRDVRVVRAAYGFGGFEAARIGENGKTTEDRLFIRAQQSITPVQ